MNGHVLLLRHWKQYNTHFLKHHGEEVKKGYEELGLDMPDFINMSRDKTLQEIKSFRGTGDLSNETKQLLKHYLKELNGDTTWI